VASDLDGALLVECLVILRTERRIAETYKLLGLLVGRPCLSIEREGRHSKADCQPSKGIKRVSFVSLDVLSHLTLVNQSHVDRPA